jgi:glutathione peroxidase
MSFFDLSATLNNGQEFNFSSLKGRVSLIVNTASACGHTHQYEALQALYSKFGGQGFEVLGFPCNQFGQQEPGTNEEIAAFCSGSFGVTFKMFSKINVNGEEAHPVYEYLKSANPDVYPVEKIKWNFTKFLVDRNGVVVGRFTPETLPAAIEASIIPLL